MELKIQKITKFKTPDQKEFLDEESAKKYMNNQFIRDQLEKSFLKDFPISRDLYKKEFRDTLEDMIDFIMRNRSFLVNILTQEVEVKVN